MDKYIRDKKALFEYRSVKSLTESSKAIQHASFVKWHRERVVQEHFKQDLKMKTAMAVKAVTIIFEAGSEPISVELSPSEIEKLKGDWHGIAQLNRGDYK